MRHNGIRATAVLVIMLAAALPAMAQETVEAETLHQAELIDEFDIDDARTLTLTHEVLYDPESSALFNRIGHMTVDPVSGRIFVVDGGDDVIRVLDEAGAHLFDIGHSGGGQGPGDLDNPWGPLITANRELAVLQFLPPRISFFDLEDGTFLRTAHIDFPISRALRGFFPLDSGDFVIGRVALTPSLYGNAIHILDPNLAAGSIPVVRSFGETQDFTAEFYETLAGGFVAKDRDGAILYTQRSPYSIRKYDAAGAELWRLDDPEAFPVAMSFLEILPNGRLKFEPFPFSSSLLPVGSNRYVHSIFLLREDGTDDAGSRFRTHLEYVTVQENVVVDRVQVDSPRRAYFSAADQKGRLYGFVDDGVFVRTTFEIKTKADAQARGGTH